MSAGKDAVEAARERIRVAHVEAKAEVQRKPGKTGIRIWPVFGWTSSALFCISLYDIILFYYTFVNPRWPVEDWFLVFLMWVAPNTLWALVTIFWGFTRQIDRGLWYQEGDSGSWTMATEKPLGIWTRTYDVTYVPEFQAAIERIVGKRAQFLVRVTRLLYKRGGVHGWPGYDGGKDRGYSLPIRTIEVSADGGKTWELVYRHPELKLGERIVYLQIFDEKRMDRIDRELATWIQAHDEEDWRPDSPIGYAEGVWWKVEELGFHFVPQGFPATVLGEKNYFEEAFRLQADVAQDLRRRLGRRRRTEERAGL